MGIEPPVLALVSGDDGGHSVPGPGHQESPRICHPAIGVMAVVASISSNLRVDIRFQKVFFG